MLRSVFLASRASKLVNALRRRAAATKARRFNTMNPPPPPPEPPQVSTRRNMALGTFCIFGGLMYYWNTNGDLLDGATLEDPVEGIPAPGGPVADEESSEPKKLSASQKIRLQVEEDKRRERESERSSSSSSDDSGEETFVGISEKTYANDSEKRVDLEKELKFLRENEKSLKKFLRERDDGGVVCTRIKSKLKEIKSDKASIKKELKQMDIKEGVSPSSGGFFVFKKS